MSELQPVSSPASWRDLPDAPPFGRPHPPAPVASSPPPDPPPPDPPAPRAPLSPWLWAGVAALVALAVLALVVWLVDDRGSDGAATSLAASSEQVDEPLLDEPPVERAPAPEPAPEPEPDVEQNREATPDQAEQPPAGPSTTAGDGGAPVDPFALLNRGVVDHGSLPEGWVVRSSRLGVDVGRDGVEVTEQLQLAGPVGPVTVTARRGEGASELGPSTGTLAGVEVVVAGDAVRWVVGDVELVAAHAGDVDELAELVAVLDVVP